MSNYGIIINYKQNLVHVDRWTFSHSKLLIIHDHGWQHKRNKMNFELYEYLEKKLLKIYV